MDKDMIKAFVFVFMVLGGFITFLSLIPSGFWVSTKTYAEQDLPEGETWSALYLQSNNETTRIRLNATGESYAFVMLGRHLEIVTATSFGTESVTLFHQYGFGYAFEEAMDWYNEENYNHGSLMNDWAFDNDYEEYDRNQYTIKCLGLAGNWLTGYSSTFHISGSLTWNLTLYDDPNEAWEANALYLDLGIGIDQGNTSINAWEVVGALLMFQRVDVFGTSTEANAMDTIMSYSIWAFIAILAFIVVMELIPF